MINISFIITSVCRSLMRSFFGIFTFKTNIKRDIIWTLTFQLRGHEQVILKSSSGTLYNFSQESWVMNPCLFLSPRLYFLSNVWPSHPDLWPSDETHQVTGPDQIKTMLRPLSRFCIPCDMTSESPWILTLLLALNPLGGKKNVLLIGFLL